MKIQVQSEDLRLRISESELACLISGQPISFDTVLADQLLFSARVELGTAVHVQRTEQRWLFVLPAAQVGDYVAQLPRRDALRWVLADAAGPQLNLDFEVDVRDSIRLRGTRRGRRAA